MADANPWAFGWTQVFTLVGFAITIIIAVGGFRTFGRWKREKIEEKRIDTAIDALALVYESKFVFDHIRGPMSFDYEWDSMPHFPGDDDQKRRQRGPFFASLKRVEKHNEFFERCWKMQVRCAALFGPPLEQTFLLLQKARREIEVSADMLYRDPYPQSNTEENRKVWEGWRSTVWGIHRFGEAAGSDKVGTLLSQFRAEVEAACRPTVDRQFRPNPRPGWYPLKTTLGTFWGLIAGKSKETDTLGSKYLSRNTWKSRLSRRVRKLREQMGI